MDVREAFPTFLVILVLAMVLWALAFVRLAFGFRTLSRARPRRSRMIMSIGAAERFVPAKG
jgi:hypothetical protein